MLQHANFGYTKKVFALDPSTFASRMLRNGMAQYSVTAVWFGRRKATRRRAAFMTTLTMNTNEVWAYQDFVDHIKSFPYGDCWDGEEVWGTTKFYEQKAIVEYLDPILKNEPNLPPTFDGWYEVVDGK